VFGGNERKKNDCFSGCCNFTGAFRGGYGIRGLGIPSRRLVVEVSAAFGRAFVRYCRYFIVEVFPIYKQRFFKLLAISLFVYAGITLESVLPVLIHYPISNLGFFDPGLEVRFSHLYCRFVGRCQCHLKKIKSFLNDLSFYPLLLNIER